jgi:acyl-CoA synthetase (NDP forming)
LNGIYKIFNPESIAVIGASSKPGKIGHECFRSLLKGGFRGKLYPINPNVQEILGVKTYSSILDIQGDIDLVIYALQAKDSVRIFREIGQKGVRAAIIISGGFRESSNSGILLEEDVIRIARDNHIRIIGPNCVGVYDGYSKVDSFFQSAERLPRPNKGSISFISQSGTFAINFLDWASDDGVGVCKVVSLGNRADVDEAELVQYLNDDDKTEVISLYIESFTNGRKLIYSIKNSKKPIIVYLASRTQSGAAVAHSHTGRLASNYFLARSIMEGVGAILVDTFQQFFDVTKTVALLSKSHGDRVIMITNGAGPCVIAADLMQDNGIKMANFSASTNENLSKSLPEYAIINNPIDLTGSATSDDFMSATKVCDEAAEVDIIALFVVFQDTPLEDEFVEKLVSNKPKKPILIFGAGGEYTKKKSRILNSNGIPTFQSVESLVSSIKALIEIGR